MHFALDRSVTRNCGVYRVEVQPANVALFARPAFVLSCRQVTGAPERFELAPLSESCRREQGAILKNGGELTLVMKASDAFEQQIQRIYELLAASGAEVIWNDHIPDP